jgi:hypothetical protein
MATGVNGLIFPTVVKPAIKGIRPEPELATTRHQLLLEKFVLEKTRKL